MSKGPAHSSDASPNERSCSPSRVVTTCAVLARGLDTTFSPSFKPTPRETSSLIPHDARTRTTLVDAYAQVIEQGAQHGARCGASIGGRLPSRRAGLAC